MICFVKDDDDMVGHFRHEFCDFFFADNCPSGIIRVCDEDKAGVFIDRSSHGIKVMHKAWVWDFYVGGTKKGSHELIDDEGVFCGDELCSWVEEAVTKEFYDFVRAVAEDGVCQLDVVFLGNGRA